MDFSDPSLENAIQTYKSKILNWIVLGGKNRLKVHAFGKNPTKLTEVHPVMRKKDLLFFVVRIIDKQMLIVWSKVTTKDKNQRLEIINNRIEIIKHYLRSKRLFTLEMKIASIDELNEKKIKEMITKVKSLRHVHYGNVETLGQKDGVISVDTAESQSINKKKFPKERAELTIDALGLDLDDSDGEEEEETEQIEKDKESLETTNKDESSKSKEDSKDLYSNGETESQADDIKSSNSTTDFIKVDNKLIEVSS